MPWDQIVKAYEYDKGHFVILKDEDFKNAAVESAQTIEIENFSPKKKLILCILKNHIISYRTKKEKKPMSYCAKL